MDTKTVWDFYAKDVERFIFSKIKNKEATNDLTQEVFIKIHTKLPSLKDIDKLKSWVFAISRNTILDYFRATKKMETVAYKDFDIVEEEESIKHDHREHDCLFSIVKKLPKKYRVPLFLADIKGVKQTDIAKTLKLPLPTVKSQIQRARKMIAQGFIECCDYKLNDKGFLVGEVKPKDACKVCD